MDKAITYVNGFGEELVFAAGSALHYRDTDLHDYTWTLSESNGEITRSKRMPRDFTLAAAVRCRGGLAERDRLSDVLDADLYANTDGTLVINGWEMRCRCTASAKDRWWYDEGVMHANLTFHAVDPTWRTDHLHHYEIADDDGGVTGLHAGFLPSRYPHGYLAPVKGEDTVEGGIGSCDMTIRFFGPVTDPYVIIAGNRYGVSGMSVPRGYRLEIDTGARTCTLVSPTGATVNAYPYLLLGAQGSGRYPFEKLPRGGGAVSWAADMSFDVVVHEERSEPPWS